MQIPANAEDMSLTKLKKLFAEYSNVDSSIAEHLKSIIDKREAKTNAFVKGYKKAPKKVPRRLRKAPTLMMTPALMTPTLIRV